MLASSTEGGMRRRYRLRWQVSLLCSSLSFLSLTGQFDQPVGK
jgi:hypothetical protein